MNAVLFILLGILFVAAALLLFAGSFVNESGIPSYGRKVHFQSGDRILYVVAHPDDEVLMSGTMSILKRKYGLPVKALYLTHGEDGPTFDLVPKSGLLQRRTLELGEVKSILELDELVIKDYPDRYLADQDYAQVLVVVKEEMVRFSPTYVFTFDENIGMYGHSDHVCAGKAATAAAAECPTVKGVFQMTLPKGMLNLAMKVSKTFRERYDREHGLPSPNVRFRMYRYAKYRLAVTRAHKTQTAVMRELQPSYDKLPIWLYYAVFDREYFYYRDFGSLRKR